MALARLSSKSQVVLPAKIRRQLQINPGDMLEITEADNAIVIRKAPYSYLEALKDCGSELWRGYEKELDQSRSQWDVPAASSDGIQNSKFKIQDR